MAVITIPQVTNWSVTPQNGQEGYFTLMNIWLSESTTVIQSFNTSVQKVNESNVEINNLASQTATNATNAINAKNTSVANANIATAAKDAILGYVVPTEATYDYSDIDDRIKSLVSASGFTTKAIDEDRFQETATPYVLDDIIQDGYIIDGILYAGGARNITKSLAVFDPSSNDSLETTTITTKAYNKADIIVCQADDKIYQTTRATSEMYDADDTATSFPYVTNKTVILCTGNNTSGVPNHFYLRTGNTVLGDPSATNFNSGWLDLGTAENMSLQNPYFQVIEDVTRHDIVVMTANDYKSFKGIKFYENIELVDKDTIANDRGWTKIDTNTYINEDGEKCFIVGIFPTGNSKMYHEQYNKKGSFKNANNEFWYNDSTPSTSIYETISKAVNNVSGRPDGLIPTKAYLNGEFGIKTMGYSYVFDNIILEEEKNINKSSSFNEYLKTETLTGASSTIWALAEKAKEIHEVLYSLDSGVTWAVQSFTPDYINNSVILGAARDYILVSYTAYDAPLKADTPTKILEEYSFVLSNNSYDIAKSNLIMNLVSGVIQAGNNTTNTELAITKIVDDVFSYTDDSTNTNPTAVYFLGLMSNNEYCIGVYGSANNLIDKSTTYIKRLGVYRK